MSMTTPLWLLLFCRGAEEELQEGHDKGKEEDKEDLKACVCVCKQGETEIASDESEYKSKGELEKNKLMVGKVEMSYAVTNLNSVQ